MFYVLILVIFTDEEKMGYDGQTDRPTDRPTNRRTDGHTLILRCRDASKKDEDEERRGEERRG